MKRLVVLSTVASREDGERIAQALLGRRLAACVNLLPSVKSLYRWKGRVEKAEEQLLLIKTRSDRFRELSRALLRLHPYEVPEMIALPIEAGHGPYLSWLDESLGPARPDPRSRLRGGRGLPPGRPEGPRHPRTRR